MRIADQPDDVTDVNGEPAADAARFVDLIAAGLEIDDTDLTLTVDTGGPISSSLAAGDEMWWAMELAPPVGVMRSSGGYAGTGRSNSPTLPLPDWTT